MSKKKPLDEYRDKRHFGRTSEPEGGETSPSGLVWGRGIYRKLEGKHESSEARSRSKSKSMSEALDEGHATFWLEGEKIRGGYALTRTGSGRKERWLLVKMNDEEADARRNPVSTEPSSVVTGRDLEEIRAQER